MKINKTYLIPLLICFFFFDLVLVAVGTYKVMNLHDFQFFGTIIRRVETDQKVIALTFDDGPTEYVTELLDVLQQKNVKVTFFLIGEQIDQHPEYARQIVTAGHQLANHSYTHKRMVLKSSDFYQDEIEKTDAAIRQAGYQGEIYFRPPYGKKLFGLPYYLSQNNRTTMTWDVEPNTDIAATEPDEKLIQHVMENVQPGSIILLHPWYGEQNNSRTSLVKLIDELRAKGYDFVTVEELVKK